MRSRSPSVFVIVLSFNTKNDTLECLDSLVRTDYAAYKIILVDNSSTDETVVAVRQTFPSIHIIKNVRNLGFAEGNNVGIGHALECGADYVLLLNDDAVVNPDTIGRLVKVADSDPRIGMLCPTIVSYHDHSREFVGAKLDWPSATAFEIEQPSGDLPDYVATDYAPGCALVVKTSVIKEIGLLDERYFAYYEDTDWSVRANRSGYSVVVVPSAKVRHKGTPDQSTKSATATYYLWRNRSLFMRKHGRLRNWPSFAKSYVRKSLERIDSHIKNADPENAYAIVDGCWAGITGQYGAQRVQAPRWFKHAVRRRLGFWLWLTGWLYFLDYRRLKREG